VHVGVAAGAGARRTLELERGVTIPAGRGRMRSGEPKPGPAVIEASAQAHRLPGIRRMAGRAGLSQPTMRTGRGLLRHEHARGKAKQGQPDQQRSHDALRRPAWQLSHRDERGA
jgi:hypothetical protein